MNTPLHLDEAPHPQLMRNSCSLRVTAQSSGSLREKKLTRIKFYEKSPAHASNPAVG
jgi:hypothetical protein